MQTDPKQTEALRDIVKLLIDNSLLLSLKEKQNITALTPLLNRQELTELFQLLLGSKRRTANIIDDLAAEYPEVVKDLEQYQLKTLQNVFKDERDILKISLIKE
ncbi:hypothetical protein ACFL10_01360 [Patescibacteria group bacterium]